MIKKLKWSTSKRLPANGLPYLKLLGNETVWENLLANKTSGISKHEVRHVWKFIQREDNPADRNFVELPIEDVDINDAIELARDTFNSKILGKSRQLATASLTHLISTPGGGGKNKTYKNIKHKPIKYAKTQKYYKK
jgi:hypothetical protein